jgi:hypothetical protein
MLINVARVCLPPFVLALLLGCRSNKEPAQEPVVVQPAVSQGALQTVGEKIDKADSRVAAAVTVAVENKENPKVVEAEGKLALSYLPVPSEGDLAFARQRAAAKDGEKAYRDQASFAKEFLAKIDADWKAAEAQSKRNASDLAAALTKVNQLEAKVKAVQTEADEKIRKIEAESSRNIWSLTGAALAVLGAVASAFVGFRVGGVILLCGVLCGSVPFVYGSTYFPWVAGLTLAGAGGLGLWRLYDYVRDLNAAKGVPPSDDASPTP